MIQIGRDRKPFSIIFHFRGQRQLHHQLRDAIDGYRIQLQPLARIQISDYTPFSLLFETRMLDRNNGCFNHVCSPFLDNPIRQCFNKTFLCLYSLPKLKQIIFKSFLCQVLYRRSINLKIIILNRERVWSQYHSHSAVCAIATPHRKPPKLIFLCLVFRKAFLYFSKCSTR